MVVNRVAEWVRHGYTTTLSHLRREVLDQRALPASKVFRGDGSFVLFSHPAADHLRAGTCGWPLEPLGHACPVEGLFMPLHACGFRCERCHTLAETAGDERVCRLCWFPVRCGPSWPVKLSGSSAPTPGEG
jgi:hypothetical protein